MLVPSPQDVQPLAPDAPAELASRRLQILVADASRVVQRIVCGLLEPRGHTVTVVGTRREFDRALAGAPFDVVLIDLPILGDDIAHALHRLAAMQPASGRRTRIVGLTMRDELAFAPHRSATDCFIAKPFQHEELLGAVETEPSDVTGPDSLPAEVLDWDSAVSDLQGREDVLRELAQTFFPECESLMRQIGEAMSRRDAAKMRRAAHTLKGAANMFCAKATAAAARNLEVLARDERLDDVATAWSLLQQEVQRLIPALKARALE